MKTFLLLLLIISFASAQWDDCPFGEVNDTCPGECGRYTDTDGDGICDHSQLAPEERVPENEQVAGTGNADPSDAKATAALAREDTGELQGTQKSEAAHGRLYYLPVIAIALIALYAASWGLAQKKKISVVAHRKLWNIVLLVTFLISGILGLILVLRISHGITIPLPFDTLFWHVEAGIAMTLISVFHIAWHWPYFKALLKV